MPVTKKRIPERRCCGCGLSMPGKEMIRIVRTPEGAIAIDETGKANGRGAYICRNAECIARAAKKDSLGRSLKASVAASVYEELKERCSAD